MIAHTDTDAEANQSDSVPSSLSNTPADNSQVKCKILYFSQRNSYSFCSRSLALIFCAVDLSVLTIVLWLVVRLKKCLCDHSNFC